MRQNHQRPTYPPTQQDPAQEHPAWPEPAATPLRDTGEALGHAWKTPWSKAGIPEPGWWRAFVIDKNVRATRTPNRITVDHATELAKAAAIVDAVTSTFEPRPPQEEASAEADNAQENPVRNQIAELRSAFQSSGLPHARDGAQGSSARPSLDARIKALQEASRKESEVTAFSEAVKQEGPILTRSRNTEVRAPQSAQVAQPDRVEKPVEAQAVVEETVEWPAEEPVARTTASFGRMSCVYTVEILSLDAAFQPLEARLEAVFEHWPEEAAEDELIQAQCGVRDVLEEAAEAAFEEAEILAADAEEIETVEAHVAEQAAEPQPEPDVDFGFLRLYEDNVPSQISVGASVVEVSAALECVAEETRIVASEPVDPPTAEIISFVPPTVRVQGVQGAYELPDIAFLAEAPVIGGPVLTEDILEESAGRLEKVIRDFGVKGEIIHVHPGPVVTLYEFEPAPGIKSARVIALADDIARSMSAVSARVAVIPGRNAIGIELPNDTRETVYLREQLESEDFKASKQKLPLCLGKTIGGEPVIADLARMPHLLVAGTTGSGKSVAINTMILSLLYRFKPEECRLIMVDPKMLELSVYDGIPHLLTPVVTDPKKAIIALRWAVREMEDRYKKMSKLGVRNIDGFNARVSEAKARGEVLTRTVQTGFDKETGQAVYEDEIMDLDPLPYIVVIVDEMADLMMVAGKDIEGAIQRLAQMARAAGIHVILATQRPSVDVITGTIKANFPTRISFQVTSKIDSRTILGEMGAEQLLGQGDMLYMAGGGRITRVHGPFCSDEEVEKVVAHLKRQGRPVYLDAVTAEEEEEHEAEEIPFEEDEMGLAPADLYDQAVSIVLRHKKASTSYIQRRLQIGYNRAASLMERMEKEGVVGPANHAGKREILIGPDGMDD